MSSRLAAQAAVRSWSRSSSRCRLVHRVLLRARFVRRVVRTGVFELLVSGGEPLAALLRGEQVGAQRLPADRRSGSGGVGWLCRDGVEVFELVAVAVEECAVDSGAAGDDSGGQIVAGGDGRGDGSQYPVAAAGGVVVAAGERGGGSGVSLCAAAALPARAATHLGSRTGPRCRTPGLPPTAG